MPETKCQRKRSDYRLKVLSLRLVWAFRFRFVVWVTLPSGKSRNLRAEGCAAVFPSFGFLSFIDCGRKPTDESERVIGAELVFQSQQARIVGCVRALNLDGPRRFLEVR